MKQDFSAIDLFQLIPASNWTEEEKIAVAVQFGQVYSAYVVSSLNEQLPDDIDAQLDDLLAHQPTPQAVEEFYQNLFPDMDDVFYERAVAFKKLFLLRLYSDKLAALEKSDQQLTASSDKRKARQRAIEQWHAIIRVAEQDNWDEVLLLVNQPFSET